MKMKIRSKYFYLKKYFVSLVIFAVCGIFIWNFKLNPSKLVQKTFKRFQSIQKVSSLGKIPTDVDVEDIYWQTLKTSRNGTLWMVNAYYDNRSHFKDLPFVRILGHYKGFDPATKLYCQVWFEDLYDDPIIVKSEYKRAWYGKEGQLAKGTVPYFINCPNPLGALGHIPTSVSLVENPAETARNHFKVINNRPADGKKKFVGVCVKDMDFPLEKDLSLRLVEWIEILLIRGVDKLFLYVQNIHPNMLRLLKYYESIGKVQIELVTVPRCTRTREFIQEMIALNDCFYKHFNEYDFLFLIDIDEFIVPNLKEDKTYHEMLERVKKNANIKDPCAYYGRNTFILDDNNHGNETQPEVPSYMYYLQHVYRAQNYTGWGSCAKSFQSTEYALVVHNHFPLRCINGPRYQEIDRSIGKLHHYRASCKTCSKEAYKDFTENTVKDLALWNIKDELMINYNKTVEALKTFKYP